jgi:hypothetical protein
VSKRAPRPVPGKFLGGFILVVVLAAVAAAIIACEDLNTGTSLAISPTVAEVATATTIPATATETTAAEEPTTLASTTTSAPIAPKASAPNVARPGVSIVPLAPAAIGTWTRFEENDSRLRYTDWWHLAFSSPFASGGTFARSYEAADLGLDIRFEGTRVRILAIRGPAYGKATVFLDFRSTFDIDLYDDDFGSLTAWTSPALADRVHFVQFYSTGEKNPASTGVGITFDAVDVIGTLVEFPDD